MYLRNKNIDAVEQACVSSTQSYTTNVKFFYSYLGNVFRLEINQIRHFILRINNKTFNYK